MCKIFISVPMSGLEDFNREAFYAAEAMLTDSGHAVLNPAWLPDGMSEEDYMTICLVMLEKSEIVYMLKGWENSSGACIEHALAIKIGKQIEYSEVL